MKKRLLSLLLSAIMVVSLFPATLSVAAASAPGVYFEKTLLDATATTPPMIKLEAYTTGSISASSEHVPTDIVLVLDQSGSMDDTVNGQTKLSIMKNAVSDFVADIAELNATGGLYRIAIVGFASQSGYDDNTEILTLQKDVTVTDTIYTEIDPDDMDRNALGNTYYVRNGQEYRALTYKTQSGFGQSAGWYTTGLFGQKIDTSRNVIYVRETTTSNVKSNGVAYDDLVSADYLNALVDCTSATIADSGIIGKAIAALDGNGATRTDLGMEMAAEIFDAQNYSGSSRQKIVVLITDGVPTTHSDFSATVANDAVTYAKAMKDDGAHIFSMYLGTPTSDSVSFLQASSSNYPGATTYNNLGTKAADSYYSAHTNSSAIAAMFKTIALSVSSNSTLNESSITTDAISAYFKLAANLGTTGTDQIEVYTVDKTASGWSSTEVPFPTANVTITDGKIIEVTGFNFAAHCVTESPKNGDGGSDYGKKLVIYIPIAVDASTDSFGGYLPTNTGAAIYQDSTATIATITADGQYYEVEINYELHGATRAHHIHTEDTYTISYSTNGNDYFNGILDEMITKLPDGQNNAGVDMTYTLYDVGTIDMNGAVGNNSSDDIKIASITIPAGDDTDVTDFANWTPASGAPSEGTITVPNTTNFAEKIYLLVCKLESTKPGSSASETVYAFLNVAITNEEASHIISGTIDQGGQLIVTPGVVGDEVAGTKLDNTYTESVTEGDHSDHMTFAPKPGYEIVLITIHDLSDEASEVDTVVYDVTNDEHKDKLNNDGSYTFQARDVDGGVEVIVDTRIKSFELTTSDDVGSEIIGSSTYTYSENTLNVPFRAISGYKLTTLTVNDVVYDLEDADRRDALASAYEAEFTLATDPEGNTIVTAGHVKVNRDQSNSVHVVSDKRDYTVTLNYYTAGGDGTYTLRNSESRTSVEFGANIADVNFPSYMPGSEVTIGEEMYSLSHWFSTYENNEFYGLTDVSTAKMPANDLTLHALWTKKPNIDIATIEVEKTVSGVNPESDTFEFVAIFHEHQVGNVAITVPQNATAPVSANMTITLTAVQEASFKSGNGVIRIYENYIAARSAEENAWLYDSAIYELKWENDAAVLYKNNTVVTNGTASFVNTVVSKDVQVSKTVSSETAKVGDTITYTVTVENKGNVDITNIQINDYFNGTGSIVYNDVESDNVTYDAQTKTFTVLSLPIGGTQTIVYTYTVLDADEGKALYNEVSVVSRHEDMTEDDDSTVTTVLVESNVTYVFTGEVPSGAAAPVDTNSPYVEGATVPVLDVPVAVVGYAFDGWYNGDTKVGATFTMPAEDVILEGKWTKLPTYTVTYTFSGEVPTGVTAPTDANTYLEGATVTVLATPDEVEGYTFDGWYNGDTKVDATFNMPAENVTLEGRWTKLPTYTVTYTFTGDVPTGVTAPTDANTYLEGAAVAVLATPDEVEGYTFDGWYNGATKVDATFAMPAENVTLEGKWTKLPTYTVTYTFTGEVPTGATVPTDSNTYLEGKPVTVLAAPAAVEGYTFDGWYNGDTKVDATFIMPAENVILEGKWTKLPTYTVTYTFTGDVPSGATAPTDSNTYLEGKPVTVLAAPAAVEGYTFDGWYNGATKVDATFTMPAENVTLEGKWTKLPTYTVTYTFTGDVPSGATVPSDENTYLEGKPVTVLAAPAAVEGYTFDGWYNGDTKVGATFTMPAENVILVGRWTKLPTYTVTYTFTGDVPAEVTAPVDTNSPYLEGATVTVLNVPAAVEGYTFDGWYNGDTKVDATFTMPAQNVILEGKWTKLPTYTVTYTFSGEVPTGATVPTDANTYLEGATVTVLATPDEVEGYTFDGWYNGAAKVNATFTMPAENVVLEGKWTKLPTYTVTYTFTGDVPTGATVPTDSNTYLEGKPVTVLAAPAAVEGYTFDGWYNGATKVDATFTMPAENVVLEGKWTKNPEAPIIPVENGTVYLTKVDAADGKTPLANTVFKLYAEGIIGHIGIYKTDANGHIIITDLPVGRYAFVEAQSTEGYKLDSTPHYFTILAGETTFVTVRNERALVPEVFTNDHVSYIVGYTDGTIKPEGTITRAEVATIFFRLLDEETRAKYLTTENSYTDVEAGMWFNTAVSTMSKMGVVKGYPDGTFRPNEYITRAEFTAIAARFETNANTTESSFADIYDHWAKKEIDIAVNNGWVLGYENGEFRPDQFITRAEAMALVNRVLQRIPESVSDLLPEMTVWPDNSDTRKWYYLTVQEATNSHDYKRKPSGYEFWTSLKENPDWTAFNG